MVAEACKAAGSKAFLRQVLLHKVTSARLNLPSKCRCDCYKTAATVLINQSMYRQNCTSEPSHATKCCTAVLCSLRFQTLRKYCVVLLDLHRLLVVVHNQRVIACHFMPWAWIE
jgi:hypothetical protein